MASNHSFDIISEIDFREVDNAMNQAIKEISQRFDLKDSHTEIVLNKKRNKFHLTQKMTIRASSQLIFFKQNLLRRYFHKSIKIFRAGTRSKRKIETND